MVDETPDGSFALVLMFEMKRRRRAAELHYEIEQFFEIAQSPARQSDRSKLPAV